MKLLLAGGDMRFAWAARLAAQQGLDVATVGLELSGFPLRQADAGFLREAEAAIMPNPWRAGFPGPLGTGEPAAESVMAALRRDAALILPDDAGAPENAPPHLCLRDDEDYVAANARLTAEGAIHAAMETLPCAALGLRALVIGYGRIGERAARLLTALGASVTVAARREQSRRRAEAAGAAACSLEELTGRLRRWRLIISTPPATVLREEQLREVDKDALLMDVASPPYGFSLERAKALGLRAVRENGLPGRYCPETAGRLLLEAALKAMRKGGKEDV